MIMSIKALETSADFASAKEAPSGGSFWKGLLYTLVSVREGIDLAAEYKTLTTRGMAPDVAARKVFERINTR
jgi:hypothetical protein